VWRTYHPPCSEREPPTSHRRTYHLPCSRKATCELSPSHTYNSCTRPHIGSYISPAFVCPQLLRLCVPHSCVCVSPTLASVCPPFMRLCPPLMRLCAPHSCVCVSPTHASVCPPLMLQTSDPLSIYNSVCVCMVANPHPDISRLRV